MNKKLNFENCNNLYDVLEIIKTEEDGVLFPIEVKIVNIIKNDYEDVIKRVREVLKENNCEELVTEEHLDEVNGHFYNLRRNVAQRIVKRAVYEDDVQWILSFFVFVARILKEHDIAFDIRLKK